MNLVESWCYPWIWSTCIQYFYKCADAVVSDFEERVYNILYSLRSNWREYKIKKIDCFNLLCDIYNWLIHLYTID